MLLFPRKIRIITAILNIPALGNPIIFACETEYF
jgi:hypothetical protein